MKEILCILCRKEMFRSSGQLVFSHKECRKRSRRIEQVQLKKIRKRRK